MATTITTYMTRVTRAIEDLDTAMRQVEAESLLRTLQANYDVDNDTHHSLRRREETRTTTLEPTSQRSSERIHITSPTHVADPQVEAVRQLEDLHPSTAEHQTANSIKPTTDTDTSVICNRPHLSIQLEKLTLPTFDGDITKFQQFWCSFELAVHKNESIDLSMKYLYLQSLLTGEAKVVLQDLEPSEDNYYHLVCALKKRFDCPWKNRAALHQALQEFPTASDAASDMRNTWFRVSGILHSLKRYEDLDKVLSIIDLVRSKFPLVIQEKLNDAEFQRGTDFDLQQVMVHLDNIITSREKFELSCSRFTTSVSSRDHSVEHQRPRPNSSPRPRSRSHSPFVTYDPAKCCFCDSYSHSSRRCDQRIQNATMLLDSGSQLSFITTTLVSKLGLHVSNTKLLKLVTFGGNSTTESSGTVRVTFEDLYGDPFTVSLNTKSCLTSSSRLPQLSSQDTKFIRDSGFDLPFYHAAGSVVPDVLIGIDYFWNIVTQEASVCLPSGLVLTHTRFGTVVSGTSFVSQGITPRTTAGIYQLLEENDDDEDVVSRLWKLERLGITDDPHEDVHTTVDTRVLAEFEDTSEIHFFSDSQIALHWIHSSRPLKQFVRNREKGISTKFHYVASEDNPADCATRGISTDANGDIWWKGPSFLQDPPENWPNDGMDYSIPPVTTSEQDQGSVEDFQLAETLLIREHYRESEHAIGQLHLDRFNAHTDELGLIRCPARLENARPTAPVLLVPSHPLTRLVILQAHTSLYHQGVYGTIAHLRIRYLIPSIYRTVGKFLRTCKVCKKINGRAYRYPDMPSLPKERVTRSRPFQK
ncbi:Tas retrotransposon peptidase A16, partial [Ancylostoma ceylanicum]